MRRIEDAFMHSLNRLMPLAGKMVLEVGCGAGYYSEQIARQCRALTAIDPDQDKLKLARCLGIPNASFIRASGEETHLSSARFDMVIFTLSLHHMPSDRMGQAIDEALRVGKPDGKLVFLEPGTRGSFFEAEIRFDAGDGDEREAKKTAKRTLSEHPHLNGLVWFSDRTTFVFDDADDFTRAMLPKKNLDGVLPFLMEHRYTLTAERYIGMYAPRA